ncbi:hypothetical protein N7490_000770 [Penicillium lividum]|nr:hypothetical protein N7490_000770 [Penicillium lividum]
MLASADDSPCDHYHLSCDDIKSSHDLLSSDHPDLCLQCAYDWSSEYSQGSQIQTPKQNRALEGLDVTLPIIHFKARMVVQRSPATDRLQEMRTDIYQRKSFKHDGWSHSTYPPSVGAEQSERDFHFMAWGSPMTLNSPFFDTFDSYTDADLLTGLGKSRYFDCSLHETDPCAQPDLDLEGHGASTSTVHFDVCETHVLFSNFCDFVCPSHNTDVDYICLDEFENPEPISDVVIDCLTQLDLDCEEADNSRIIELTQAFRRGASSDVTPKLSDGSNQKSRTKPLPTLNHSDSRNSLWRANMSSASSPDFRDKKTEWFSDFELVSFGTDTILDTPVELRATANFLKLSDEEDGGCLLGDW